MMCGDGINDSPALATADKTAICIALDEIYDGSVAPSDLND